MNLVLLDPHELAPAQPVILSGRRFTHITKVLRAHPGDTLKIGVLNGRMGIGTVTVIDRQSLSLTVSLDSEPPPPRRLHLVLALPRPKVLNRVVAMTASLGIKHLFLINAWKVERSYWNSPRLAEDELQQHLRLGLEQAVDTVMPTLICRRFFRDFVAIDLPKLAQTTRLLIAHPTPNQSATASPTQANTTEDTDSTDSTNRADRTDSDARTDTSESDSGSDSGPDSDSRPVTLFIGPEGGFTEIETATLAAAGGRFLSLGPRILRVETAIPAAVFRIDQTGR